MKKKMFMVFLRNKKGFTLVELIISLFLTLLVFIIVISNLNTYTYLIYPNLKVTQDMVTNNFYFKALERDFAYSSTVITKKDTSNTDEPIFPPWFAKEPTTIRLIQIPSAGPNLTSFNYIDYYFYVNEIKRNMKTIITTSNLKWYIVNYEDKTIATNDPLYSGDLLDYKKLVVKDGEEEHVIGYLNTLPNSATRVFGYFIDEENNIPYFFSSTKIIRPEYRSKKEENDYTPIVVINGKKYTYYTITDEKKEIKATDIQINNNELTFKLLVKSTNSPLANKYGIVLVKESRNVYGYKTDDYGEVSITLNSNDVNSPLYILFFGDNEYEELEILFNQ